MEDLLRDEFVADLVRTQASNDEVKIDVHEECREELADAKQTIQQLQEELDALKLDFSRKTSRWKEALAAAKLRLTKAEAETVLKAPSDEDGAAGTPEGVRSENLFRIAFLRQQFALGDVISADVLRAVNLLRKEAELRFGHLTKEWTLSYQDLVLKEKFCEIALRYAEKILFKDHIDLEKDELAFDILTNIYSILWDLTDCCDEMRIQVAESGFVAFLLNGLKNFREAEKMCDSEQRIYLIQVSEALSILYNTSRCSKVVPFFRQNGADKIIAPYIASKFHHVLQVSLCLAYITGDDDTEVVQLLEKYGIITTLISMAKEAASNAARIGAGFGSTWSLFELLDGLSLFAETRRKKLIYNSDFVSLLNLLLTSDEEDSSDVENLRGVELLKRLCCSSDSDETIRNLVKSRYQIEIVNPLKALAHSSHTNQDVKNAAKQLLADEK